MTSSGFDQLRARLREVVKIVDLLESIGHHVHLNNRGTGTTKCPFHNDHRPSLSVYNGNGIERFNCYGCGTHGDVFDFARLQSGDPDHLSTLRRLAEKHQIPWPEALSQNGQKPNDVIHRAARFYQRGLTTPVLEYLAGRGFPEPFVRERQIGYVPVGTGTTTTRLADEARKVGLIDDAVTAGLVLKYRNGRYRDFFWSDSRGFIIFPNLMDGKAVSLQGRAYPAGSTTKSKYLNLPGSTHQLYNPRDAAFRSVILCEGIPDTMSAMLAKIPDTGACGIMGTAGWQDDWLRLFRRASRIYVALDRDAEIKAIDVARAFGTRGRVLVLPESLGPKGDLNDWLCGPGERNPDAFRAMLQKAMGASLTPYALLADRIPESVARWDLEHVALIPSAQRHTGGDYTGLDLLRELGHHDPVFRDSHLLRIAERVGLPFSTLQEAALELARENGA
jgi:DNA primase catalytic core